MTLEALGFGTRDYLAVVAGGVAYFALGALWFSALFGRRWMAATGRSAEEFADASPGPGMLLTLVGAVVTAGVVAAVFGWAGGSGVLDGMAAGALIGVGVAAMEGMKGAVYSFDDRARPWALYAINAGYAVCGLVVAGAVYALIA